jgi:uroporphyrinogen-III synthase
MKIAAGPVALFRAHEDCAGTVARLAERGIAAVIAPVTELEAAPAELPSGRFDFALATSAKAIEFAPAEALAAIRDLPLYVVGEKTAAAARAQGCAPAAVAPDVGRLAPQLDGVGGRALYLAGRDRKPDLETALSGRLVALVVYAARERAGWSAEEAQAVAGAAAALHYSERGAALASAFAEAAGVGAAFRRLRHVCMARHVAAPLAALRAFWPQSPTELALLDTLESALAD